MVNGFCPGEGEGLVTLLLLTSIPRLRGNFGALERSSERTWTISSLTLDLINEPYQSLIL